MREVHREALLRHRLGNEILATKIANRMVNRMGPSIALDLTEEEGSSLAQVVSAFLTAERLLKLDLLWERIEHAPVSEAVRLDLFAMAAQSVRSHMSDILRAAGGETNVSELVALLEPGLTKIDAAARSIIRDEVKAQAVSLSRSLEGLGAGEAIVRGLVKLYELDGVFGIAGLSAGKDMDALALTQAYVRIGEELGIDWAQSEALRLQPTDQWERLLVAGLLNEFEQLRIDWLSRTRGDDPVQAVERWAERQAKRIAQFRRLIDRARGAGSVSVPMLAQIASQARILLAR
jgi:glutamate dehydrogenase